MLGSKGKESRQPLPPPLLLLSLPLTPASLLCMHGHARLLFRTLAKHCFYLCHLKLFISFSKETLFLFPQDDKIEKCSWQTI